MGRKVRVEELVDLTRLRTDGQRPTPKQIRDALPRGWVLDEFLQVATSTGQMTSHCATSHPHQPMKKYARRLVVTENLLKIPSIFRRLYQGRYI